MGGIQRFQFSGRSSRQCQRLIEIRNDVVFVFDAD